LEGLHRKTIEIVGPVSVVDDEQVLNVEENEGVLRLVVDLQFEA
jgi:hypothetical protein